MRSLLLLTALWALAGCAGAVTTTTVEVPVPVPCKVPDVPRPELAIDSVKAGDDVFVVVRALWASLEQYEAYETQLRASIDSCK